MPAYQREVLVRFAHCDPAGIVFYARYFEMINGVVEDWFEDALEASFSGLLFHRNLATPTVHFNVDFTGRSMMGDRLTFETSVMTATFETAVEAAQAEGFWRTPVARAEPWSDFLDRLKP